MSRTYKEWLNYYFNATKEQVIEDVTQDNLEIERLNNIINELEKYICEIEYDTRLVDSIWRPVALIHNKLNELKGDSSNE